MSPEPLKNLWNVARNHNEPPDSLYGLLFDIFLNPDNLKGIQCDEFGKVIHPTAGEPQDFLIGTLNAIDQETGEPTADKYGYVRFDLANNEVQFAYRVEDENRPGYYGIAHHQLFVCDNRIRSLSGLFPFQVPQGRNSFLRITDDFLFKDSELSIISFLIMPEFWLRFLRLMYFPQAKKPVLQWLLPG